MMGTKNHTYFNKPCNKSNACQDKTKIKQHVKNTVGKLLANITQNLVFLLCVAGKVYLEQVEKKI